MPQLQEFEGRWRIARRIEDAWMGTTALFEGVARFTDDRRGLAYREVGELRVPQEVPLAASREYLWRAEPGGIAVLYGDGRFSHRIKSGADVVQDWHVCGEDEYDVTYNFTHWPRWRMIWKVQGPRKDYVSISDFVRL